MPRRSKTKKDADGCEKPRGAAKRALIRGYPNGATRLVYRAPVTEYIGGEEDTRGIETSQYPQEKKSIEIPVVVASETGEAQTRDDNILGVVGPAFSLISC